MHRAELLTRYPLRRAAACALAAVLVTCCPHRSSAEIRNSITIGYDSFIDRYTILEDDTLESIQELHTGLSNELSHRKNGFKAALRNMFRYGSQTIDENLDGEISLDGWNEMRLDIRSNLYWKQFQEGSDYSFGNDYMQSNTYVKLKRTFKDDLGVSLKSRFELLDYENRTDFDYDYRYFDSGIEVEKGSYFRHLLRLGAAVGFREAPDTSALSYRRTIADVEFQAVTDDRIFYHFTAAGDRRDYRENVRSSYWNIFSYADVTVNTASGRSYSIKAESEIMLFDDPSSTFFDTQFYRAGFKAKFPVHSLTSLHVEPRYAAMLCRDFEEERYREFSAVLGIDMIGGGDFWLTAAYEPGYRSYIDDENELYSDFYLNRLSLIGSITASGDVTFNLFLSHDPERHTRRDDDFSITLISIDMTKRF
jgi:hypothetical protein